MKVKVRFFAAMREAIGRTEVALELSPGTTVQQLTELIAERYPVLCPYLNAALVAVNRRYALSDTGLHDGDEVAFVPPLGGG
ncbi:MAG: MoaD/ThiS family protein [Anaerolineae bacterium]